MRPHDTSPALSYIESLYAPEDALLARIRNAVPEGKRGMQVGAVEGKILATLLTLARAERVLEIGTCAGYSAIWMARALPASGTLHTIERDTDMAALARTHFETSEVANKITLHEGDALSVLASLGDAVWDAVFIDADKSGYPRYLDWAETHVRPGGLIIADNTLLFGAVYGEESSRASATMKQAMKEFNTRLADPSRFMSVMLPTVEGLSVAVRK